MIVYSDEDNVPMTHEIPLEYTWIINERLFRETGELIIKRKNEREEKENA